MRVYICDGLLSSSRGLESVSTGAFFIFIRAAVSIERSATQRPAAAAERDNVVATAGAAGATPVGKAEGVYHKTAGNRCVRHCFARFAGVFVCVLRGDG